MKNSKRTTLIAKGFILLSAFSLFSVSLMAYFDPQSVMRLVDVSLGNNDALSSIRGVYGGVGTALFISLIYLVRRNVPLGLRLLCLIWGCYAFSRLLTIVADGALGAFGQKWLLIESVFFGIALTLTLLLRGQRTPAVPAVA
ncbi:MAG: DUF4345 domain-containing protein [Chitinophagaceae bacterium]|nr:MAG: DUF4345 domain-containing protein [Chitinophagaceae bacterium]